MVNVNSYFEDLVCAHCGHPALVLVSRNISVCGERLNYDPNIFCIRLTHDETTAHYAEDDEGRSYRW